VSLADGNANRPDEDAAWTALRRRDKILLAVSYAAERFLGQEPLDSVLTDVLERLGKAAEVGDATVFELVDDTERGGCLVPRYSWSAPGAESVFDFAPDGFAWAGTDFAHLFALLEQGQPLVARVEELPAGLRALLAGDMSAIAALPIFAAGQLVGVIAVSRRGGPRDWAESEIGALKTAAAVTGAALERNRSRRAVRRRDELLRLIVDNAPLMVAYFDHARRCRFANRRYQESFGVPDDPVLGKTLEEIIGAEDCRATEPYWKRTQAGEQVTFEHAHDRADGTRQHLEVSAVPHRTESGEVAGCYVILTDITERKQSEESLRRAHDQLEEKVRERTEELLMLNRELEAFSYSVSHDLRAPLRAIDGFSHLIEEQLAGKLDAETENYFGRIRAAVQRMFWMIEGLLELGRASRKEIDATQVDLSLCAREIVEDLAAGNGARRVEWIIEDGLRAVGDRQLLRLLLQNLLENAWKYTARCEAARIEFRAGQAADGTPEFTIRDNGAGFDMAHAQRLFQPFQRLHSTRDFDGTGIGLATVARIVHRHGGRIRAEGTPGRGASFHFTLPT